MKHTEIKSEIDSLRNYMERLGSKDDVRMTEIVGMIADILDKIVDEIPGFGY